MKTIFLNRRNIFLLFVFFFFVSIFQYCKKDKQVPKFDYKETFDDSVSVKSWILDHVSISDIDPINPNMKLKSKELFIRLDGQYSWGSAIRNFTNFEGTKSMVLTTGNIPSGGDGVWLNQIRNGKLFKTAQYFNSKTDNGSTCVTVQDTFLLLKTDTLQIGLGSTYTTVNDLSVPTYAFYDNIELREQ